MVDHESHSFAFASLWAKIQSPKGLLTVSFLGPASVSFPADSFFFALLCFCVQFIAGFCPVFAEECFELR